MEIDGKPHTHSFYRDSDEVRVVEAVTREGQGSSIRSKIEKLLVLKSTGSAFHGFHRDEYTRLPETWDRILSTDIEAGWQWNRVLTLEPEPERRAEVEQKLLQGLPTPPVTGSQP